MKALIWVADGKMKIDDVPEPEPREGWVLLRVSQTGICGSEVSAYLGLNELRRPPLIMGHEFSGIVEKTAGIENEMEGKLVAVNPLVTCGKCIFCISGLRNLCPHRQIVGAAFQGSFAEFVCVPADSCYPVGNPMCGALAEPLATAIRAVDRCNLATDDRAMVFGMGIIGLFILKLLRYKGVRECIVADLNEQRLRTARASGASHVINMSGKKATEEMLKYFDGGVDFSFDAVGVETTRSYCISVLRSGGKAVFVGNHDNTTRIDGNTVVRREITVEGSYAYTDREFQRSVKLAQTDFIGSSPEWLTVRSLKEGPTIFSELASNKIPYSKVILKSRGKG